MQSPVDVVCVGNAIVDVIVQTDDAFLERFGLDKGSMALVDADRSAEIYEAIGTGATSAGGSAGNTAAGIASFGGSVAFVGKVRDDALGEAFATDTREPGVAFDVPYATEGPDTACCMVLVTPDAERTMNTYLGISSLLEPDDVDAELLANTGIVFCEGYLWDVDIAKQAIMKAMDAAKAGGARCAFTMSDSFCVNRHLDEWTDLVNDRVDVLFANTDEICAFFGTDDFDVAADKIAGVVDIAVLTRSGKGSLIIADGERIEVPAEPVAHVVDTTGAGDLYAAGFLFGLSKDLPLAECGRLASVAASEVISHLGARPHVSLAELVGEAS